MTKLMVSQQVQIDDYGFSFVTFDEFAHDYLF